MEQIKQKIKDVKRKLCTFPILELNKKAESELFELLKEIYFKGNWMGKFKTEISRDKAWSDFLTNIEQDET